MRKGIDADPSEPTQIYHQTVITTSQSGTVVSAAAHGDEQMMISTKVHSSDDIRHIGAARNEQRPFVYHGVVEHALLFESPVCRRD
jgi:hypothetical protein